MNEQDLTERDIRAIYQVARERAAGPEHTFDDGARRYTAEKLMTLCEIALGGGGPLAAVARAGVASAIRSHAPEGDLSYPELLALRRVGRAGCLERLRARGVDELTAQSLIDRASPPSRKPWQGPRPTPARRRVTARAACVEAEQELAQAAALPADAPGAAFSPAARTWDGIAKLMGRTARSVRMLAQRPVDPLPVYAVGGVVTLERGAYEAWLGRQRVRSGFAASSPWRAEPPTVDEVRGHAWWWVRGPSTTMCPMTLDEESLGVYVKLFGLGAEWAKAEVPRG